MKYQEALTQSMEFLARDEKRIFIGYNIRHGSQAYATLKPVQSKCLEMPVAENLMVGLAIGMSLEGYKPVIFFERQDFMLNALDSIVNHLDKFREMSKGGFNPSVIIRATVGTNKPLDPGMQHTQDYSEQFKAMIRNFPIIPLMDSKSILNQYKKSASLDSPVMFVERRDLYDKDFDVF